MYKRGMEGQSSHYIKHRENGSGIDNPRELLRACIREEGVPMHRDRHEIIFHAGRAADEIYLLNKGIIAITHHCEAGYRQIYGFISNASFIIPPVGEGNIVRHSAECLTDADMHVISRHTIDRIVDTNPKIARAINEEFGQMIDHLHDHLSNLLCRHGEARVAYILSKLHRDLTLAESMLNTATPSVVWIEITQIDLAAAIGMTPVYLNQILKKMKDYGWIELKSGKVRVASIKKLEEFLY